MSGLQPVRMAFVVHSFQAGGLERCVARLCNRLNRATFQPMIVCLDRNGAAAEWLECDDVPIVELRKRNGNDVRVVSRLARVLRENSVRLVQSHNWGTLVETTLARRLGATPVHIHAERGMELEALHAPSWKKRLRRIASGWAIRRADCVLTNCEAIRRRLIEDCQPLRRRIQVIPNGVTRPIDDASRETAARLRREYNIPDEAIVVGSVGRLAPVKDFSRAIEATAILRRRQHDVHLVLVGDGPERSALLSCAQQRDIANRVHIVGWCPDAGSWLAAMDVYLNVSLNEGMSQSILEAMASGLPAVVTDVGDSAHMVGGTDPCGLVVPPGDAEATAAALERLICDHPFRMKCRENAAWRHETRYRLETMVRAFTELYGELLGPVATGSAVRDPVSGTDSPSAAAISVRLDGPAFPARAER